VNEDLASAADVSAPRSSLRAARHSGSLKVILVVKTPPSTGGIPGASAAVWRIAIDPD
jgi:hypothetical protein